MKVTFYARKYRQSNGWSWIDRFDIQKGRVYRSSHRYLDRMDEVFSNYDRPIQALKYCLKHNYEARVCRPTPGYRGVQINVFGKVTNHA